MSRVIGHLDLDYFYAQVEEVEDPPLRSKPVVVCVYSGRTEESGVVSTSNYKAREHGVKSGMPIALAKRKLEGVDAAFIPMDRPKYELYSERIMELLRGRADVLEQAGIDEAFFDVSRATGGDYGKAEVLAREIKDAVYRDEGLSCSIGIGPSKVIAKIASDFQKPNGLTVVKEDEVGKFLAALPVGKIYGVGPKTAKLLEDKGVSTISQLAGVSPQDLEETFGRKLAVYLVNASRGLDDEPVVDRQGVTQLMRIITLKQDTHDVEQVVKELLPALHDLDERLVSKSLFFKNVTAIGILKDLSQHTRSKTIETPTNEYQVLERETRTLFAALLREVGDLRRAGVRTSDLHDMVDQSSLTEFTA